MSVNVNGSAGVYGENSARLPQSLCLAPASRGSNTLTEAPWGEAAGSRACEGLCSCAALRKLLTWEMHALAVMPVKILGTR